jgi:hypothetical protein
MAPFSFPGTAAREARRLSMDRTFSFDVSLLTWLPVILATRMPSLGTEFVSLRHTMSLK